MKRENKLPHKRTIFVGEFSYKGRRYTIHYDFECDYSEDDALFLFTEGNCGCDCNLSRFIRKEYGDVIPELDCGCEIEMKNYHLEYEDFSTEEM